VEKPDRALRCFSAKQRSVGPLVEASRNRTFCGRQTYDAWPASVPISRAWQTSFATKAEKLDRFLALAVQTVGYALM
jgi:hypothetical protein